MLNEAKEIGSEDINKYVTIIKFFCLQDNVIIPPPKPKVET